MGHPDVQACARASHTEPLGEGIGHFGQVPLLRVLPGRQGTYVIIVHTLNHIMIAGGMLWYMQCLCVCVCVCMAVLESRSISNDVCTV